MKRIEIQKKQRKLQVFFPYAIWVFKIFWQKKLSMSQIGEIQQSKKGAPLLCSVGEWREIV